MDKKRIEQLLLGIMMFILINGIILLMTNGTKEDLILGIIYIVLDAWLTIKVIKNTKGK